MSRIKKQAVFSALFLLTFNAFGQQHDITEIKGKVAKVIRENFNEKKIKDSTAIYSFTITIKVVNSKGKQQVVTAINNPIVDSFFEGLDKLKEINYAILLGKHKYKSFSFKGYILVYDSKYGAKVISSPTIPQSLSYLFLKDETDVENLGNIVIEYDKKIYN